MLLAANNPLKVLISVIVIQLFAGFNLSERSNIHPAFGKVYFAVRLAGVVYITSGIFSAGAIDINIFFNLEQVPPQPAIGFIIIYNFANVFNNEFIFGNFFPGIQA